MHMHIFQISFTFVSWKKVLKNVEDYFSTRAPLLYALLQTFMPEVKASSRQVN